MAADFKYLSDLRAEMAVQWPNNRIINIVCHGHSVPAGYFATPLVNTFNAYPHLLHRLIKERFPYATVNVISTGIGGEESNRGAARFERDALCHKPDVITIDYGLNDRRLGLDVSQRSMETMIQAALSKQVKVILMTPTWDRSYFTKDEEWEKLVQQAEMIRMLADRYEVGLADSFKRFEDYIDGNDAKLTELLSHVNHPSRKGHELAAAAIGAYFLAE